MGIEEQADEVQKVKRSENGVITNPFFLTPDESVYEAEALMGKYRISGVPIVKMKNQEHSLVLLQTVTYVLLKISQLKFQM